MEGLTSNRISGQRGRGTGTYLSWLGVLYVMCLVFICWCGDTMRTVTCKDWLYMCTETAMRRSVALAVGPESRRARGCRHTRSRFRKFDSKFACACSAQKFPESGRPDKIYCRVTVSYASTRRRSETTHNAPRQTKYQCKTQDAMPYSLHTGCVLTALSRGERMRRRASCARRRDRLAAPKSD